MKTFVKEFAREIYSSDGEVKLYSLNEKYGINPIDAIFAAKLFSKYGIGHLDDKKFVVGDNAREWLDAHRSRFFLDSRKPWSVIIRKRLNPSEPYMPDLGKIDADFFIKKVAR